MIGKANWGFVLVSAAVSGVLGATAAFAVGRRTVRRLYAMGALGQVDICRQIRAGKSQELVDSIEAALPAYITGVVSEFGRNDETEPVLVSAGRYYRENSIPIPASVQVVI